MTCKKAFLKEFHSFLRVEEITDKYMKAIERYPKHEYRSLDEFFKETDASQWIGRAFHWDKTPERYIFWLDIYDKWDECKDYFEAFQKNYVRPNDVTQYAKEHLDGLIQGINKAKNKTEVIVAINKFYLEDD
jgi:tRNA-dihydrouridine synthase